MLCIIRNGQLKIRIPKPQIRNGKVWAMSSKGWAPVVDSEAAALHGISKEQCQAWAKAGEYDKFPADTIASLGENPSGLLVIDADEWDAREKVRYAEMATAGNLVKYAAQVAEAAATGKPVLIDHWTETRRANEGGEWGEYLFVVELYIRADGSTFQKATNTY